MSTDITMLNNALQNAAKIGDFPLIKELLRSGAEVNCTSSMGWTPLMVLVFHCKSENRGDIARYLIKQGASLTMHNHYAGSVRGLAIFRGDPVYLDVLVNAGMPLDELDNDYDSFGRTNGGRAPRETPLIFAIRNRKRDLVDRLLDCGADPSVPDAKGVLPRIHALAVGDMDILSLLEGAVVA